MMHIKLGARNCITNITLDKSSSLIKELIKKKNHINMFIFTTGPEPISKGRIVFN